MTILQILIPTWWWCFFSSSGCEKTFITFSALFSHNRTHFREMAQFTCTYPGCDKRYDKACRLKIHLRSHTGEKTHRYLNKVISLLCSNTSHFFSRWKTFCLWFWFLWLDLHKHVQIAEAQTVRSRVSNLLYPYMHGRLYCISYCSTSLL